MNVIEVDRIPDSGQVTVIWHHNGQMWSGLFKNSNGNLLRYSNFEDMWRRVSREEFEELFASKGARFYATHKEIDELSRSELKDLISDNLNADDMAEMIIDLRSELVHLRDVFETQDSKLYSPIFNRVDKAIDDLDEKLK